MAESEEKSTGNDGSRSGATGVETGFYRESIASIAESQKVVEKAMLAAEAGAVFGAPVERGDYTVITCSDVGGGLGVGFGSGADEEGAGGGGGGGGGGSFGRPVAVIVIGPNGVEVQPVFDITKVGIAAVAAFGALLMAWGRMRSD